MAIKPFWPILPLLALSACASNPPQTVQLSNSLASAGIINLSRDTVINLPDLTLAMPEASISLPFAHVSIDELPQPPVKGFTCGWVHWEPYPIRFWDGLRDVPHIQFTFLTSYETWVPIEGKVYQNSVYRLGRIN